MRKTNKTRQLNKVLVLILSIALLLSVTPTTFAATYEVFSHNGKDYYSLSADTITVIEEDEEIDEFGSFYTKCIECTAPLTITLLCDNDYFTISDKTYYRPEIDSTYVSGEILADGMSIYEALGLTGGTTFTLKEPGIYQLQASIGANLEDNVYSMLYITVLGTRTKVPDNYIGPDPNSFQEQMAGSGETADIMSPVPTVADELVLANALSISNVINKVPASELIGEKDIFPTDEVYIANGPVSITALKDFNEFILFGLSPMSSNGGYAYIEYGGFYPVGCEEAIWNLTTGMRYELTKPGFYYFHSMEDGICESLYIKDVPANPTASKIIINGKTVEFEAYNIYDNNHFKLRDIAQALIGTEKQFEVTWNGEKNLIDLVSNKVYTSVGGEMALGDGTQKRGTLCESTIMKDGEECYLTAYTINNNNFFKLRDLGELFDFEVDWAGTNIIIDTSKSYTAD